MQLKPRFFVTSKAAARCILHDVGSVSGVYIDAASSTYLLNHFSSVKTSSFVEAASNSLAQMQTFDKCQISIHDKKKKVADDDSSTFINLDKTLTATSSSSTAASAIFN